MKQHVLVARAIPQPVLARLAEHFEVEANLDDAIFSAEELKQRLQGKSGAFTTGTERIDAALLDACPLLRAVCNMAVGYNNFDVEACTARGVLCTNTPDVLTETTADFGFALMMAAARRIAESERFLRRGEWTKWSFDMFTGGDVEACTARGVLCTNTPDVLTETTADFGFALMMAAARRIAESERFLRRGEWTKWSFDMFTGGDVHGATLGVLGMGRIGQAIARRGALGFGMPVIYHNRSRLGAAAEAQLGARHVSKEALLREADHLVIVVPYSPATHHAVGASELALMKPTATLTNIARGGVVDDAALAAALRERRIAAAGLDVFEGEPTVHPDLLVVPNVVLTPHIASATVATRLAMADLAADNLIAALGCGPRAGRPPTPINPQVQQPTA